MSAAFTPGPWHYLDIGEIVPSDSDGYPNADVRICYMATPGSAINAHERLEANAHLIAAAPTMAGYIQRKAEAGDNEAQEIWEVACGRRS